MSQFQFSNGSAPLTTAYEKTVNNTRDLLEAGQYESAIAMLLGALKQSPKDVQVMRMLAHAMMMLDAPLDAIKHLSFATRLDPSNLDLLCDLATAYRRIDEIRKAHQTIDQALKIAPSYPKAVMGKARLLQSHGQPEKAFELVRECYTQTKDSTLLSTYGQLCRELKLQSEGIDAVRAGLDNPALPRNIRQDLLFVLGHLLDSVGEYDEAFHNFSKGNSMSAAPSEVDLEKYLNRWAIDKFNQVPSADCDGSRAVFIVGMPRSGTTLTEQIIASHPNAGGVGESQLIDSFVRGRELVDYDSAYVNQSANAYLAMLKKNFPDQSIKRVCDKMPENFYFLGFISKILPGSHIIHCKRDPIDTCLSIYFQRFGPRMVYAMDLESCATQYITYTKVIEYLTQTIGIKMHEAVYEETTANPEPSIRAMLEHIGLPFDPACMDFHKSKKSVHTASATQIRQPIYTSSSQRWKNYEKHIGPLIEKLAPVLES